MSVTNIWESVLSAVEKRVNHESFTTWFKPIAFVEIDGTALRLRVPDQVFEDWILNNYQDILEESLDEAGISGCSVTFEVRVNSGSRADFAKVVTNFDDSSIKTRVSPSRSVPPARQVFSTTSFSGPQFVDAELTDTPLNQK